MLLGDELIYSSDVDWSNRQIQDLATLLGTRRITKVRLKHSACYNGVCGHMYMCIYIELYWKSLVSCSNVGREIYIIYII